MQTFEIQQPAVRLSTIFYIFLQSNFLKNIRYLFRIYNDIEPRLQILNIVICNFSHR